MRVTERILITGAQGFVGRFLVAQLLEGDDDVKILGVGRSVRSDTFTHDISVGGRRLRAPLTSALECAARDRRYTYISADIRAAEQIGPIVTQFRPAYVYHLAAGLRDDDPGHLFGTNVQGTIAVLEAVKRVDEPSCVVLGSSGSVYGAASHVPIAEDERCEPRDIYAASKLASEHVARITLDSTRVTLTIARIFNIVGPGQEERHAVGRFASQVAAIASGSAQERLEVGDLSTTRDFIDVRDVAGALIALAKQGQSGIYNVGSGVETQIASILEVLLGAVNLGGMRIERRYARASDIPRLVADIGKLRSVYRPSFSLDRMVRDVLEYYLALPVTSDGAKHIGS
jgi:nucleoside-diphosphate-sugar epimerase